MLPPAVEGSKCLLQFAMVVKLDLRLRRHLANNDEHGLPAALQQKHDAEDRHARHRVVRLPNLAAIGCAAPWLWLRACGKDAQPHGR